MRRAPGIVKGFTQLLRRVPGFLRRFGFETHRPERHISMMRKLTALMRKQSPSPATPTMSPASDGPTMRAP